MTDTSLQDQLYTEILGKKELNLNSLQAEKFRYACEKAILENPGVEYTDLLLVCKIYLNFIMDWPHLDLGPVKFLIESIGQLEI